MVENASIITFGNNASAMVMSYECDYRTGNVPVSYTHLTLPTKA